MTIAEFLSPIYTGVYYLTTATISTKRIYFYQTYSGIVQQFLWNSNVKDTDRITLQSRLHILVQVISSFVQHPHDQFRQHKHL